MGRYAVVKTGGKQYRVAEGELVDVERLSGDVGATVTLDEVLLVSGDGDDEARIGTPTVDQAQVTAEIVRGSTRRSSSSRRNGGRATSGSRATASSRRP